MVVTKRNVAAALTAGIGDPNAIAKLAKIAGYSSGIRILITARGGAPRSMAAFAYSLRIDKIRARTMMTG